MEQIYDKNDIKHWQGIDDFILRLVNNFGKINKNDLEIELMHLLLINDCSSISDYRMSKMLRVPETKIKRLRYETSLVYQDNEEELKEKIIVILTNTRIKIHDTKLQIAVNDRYLRNYISDLLASDNRFYDSSFNSNIITLSSDDVFYLLEKLSGKKGEKYTKKIREKIDNSEFPKTFMQNLKDAIPEFIKQVGATATGNALGSNSVVSLLKIISNLI